jgi:hypothetical protein
LEDKTSGEMPGMEGELRLRVYLEREDGLGFSFRSGMKWIMGFKLLVIKDNQQNQYLVQFLL